MDVYISQLLPNQTLDTLTKRYHCGLEIIDYSIAQCLDNSQAKLNKFYKENYADIKLGIHAPYFDLIPATYDNEIKKVVKNRFQQAYDCALAIKAEYIVYHTGFLKDIYFYESWLANSLLFWEDFLADKDGSIKIFIENVFEEEIGHLVELVSKINKPFFKICLDIGHANVHTNDIFNWLAKTRKYLGHVHLHNNDGNNDLHQSLLTGDVDYNNVLKYLNQEHPDISLCLEISEEKDLVESLNLVEEVLR